jgi:uncharacterized protein
MEIAMRFAGYAAVFDRVDHGGDVIRKGAFAAELGKTVPLLWQHDRTRPIGAIEMLAEDAKGLRVIGKVDDAALVQPGSGLSFGYRVRQATSSRASGKNVFREGAYRELVSLELVEVSVVKVPMQPLARVHAVEG